MILPKTAISSKIIYASLLSVLVISALSTGVSFYMSYTSLKEKNIEVNESALKQNVNNIESMLSKAEMYITTFLEDDGFNNTLTRYSPAGKDNPDTIKSLENFLYELSSSCKEIQFFYLVTPDSRLITNDQSANTRLDYGYLSGKLIDAASEFSWTYTNFELTSFSDSILLTKRLTNSTGREIGIISISINNNYVTNFYRNVSRNGDSFAMLTPDMKPVLSSLALPADAGAELANSLAASEDGNFSHGRTIYLFHKSTYTGWIGIQTFDYNKMMIPVLAALRHSIAVFLICVMISFGLASLYASSFRKSINSIRRGMNKAVEENLNTQIHTRHFVHWSYRNSLLLLFCLTILVPILISISFAYFMFIGALKDEIVNYYGGSLYSLKTEITSNIESYEQAAHYITFNPNILQAVKDSAGSANTNAQRSTGIDRIITKQQKIRSGAFYVNIVNADKQYVYSSIPMSKDALRDYVQTMDATGVPKRFFDTRTDYYNRYVITLGKKILDIDAPERGLGFVFLNMYEKDISELYGKYNTGNVLSTFIMDRNGTVISDNRKDMIGHNIAQIYSKVEWPKEYGSSGSFVQKTGGKEYLIQYSLMGNLDWVLVSRVLVVDLLNNSILTANLYIVLASLIIVFIGSYVLSRHIIMPLHRLSRSLNKIAVGDFHENVIQHSGNEIEELSLNFNRMVQQLRTLIKEAYESKIERQHLEIKRNEAELTAFQAQIQPHFLYNTLEVIHCKAMLLAEGDNDVSFLIAKLADFLRFVTSRKDPLISMNDEFAHARNYIDIMRSCGSECEVRWSVDESLLDCSTPKLILQPLLENALNHGMQKMPQRRGVIVITIGERNGVIRIRVADNGAGIHRSKLEQLRRMLTENLPDSHIGLMNVHQRIVLSFGPSYGLRIVSRAGRGTVVTIAMPKLLPQPER